MQHRSFPWVTTRPLAENFAIIYTARNINFAIKFCHYTASQICEFHAIVRTTDCPTHKAMASCQSVGCSLEMMYGCLLLQGKATAF